MGSSQAIPPECLSASILLGDSVEFLASTWIGRTNHLEYSIEGWGPNSALCFMYNLYKSQVKIT